MSIAVPLYGFGASGGEGGTLKVNAPPLVAVTITNKAGKTKTKTANADGMAIFKGLASGKWNVTIVNSDGKPTTITADVQTEYTVTIAFFSATINITYPAGSTCTATDGTTILTAPDTSGTWVCVVPNAGTWTITALTGGGLTASKSISISNDGQTESAALKYELVLYDVSSGGNVNDDITGGWSGMPTIAHGGLGYTLHAVDVTEYDTLVFTTQHGEGQPWGTTVQFGLWATGSTPFNQNAVVQAEYFKSNAAIDIPTVVTLDISNVTGSYLIAARNITGWNSSGTYKVTSVKLIPKGSL